jgi:hypothetical protein
MHLTRVPNNQMTSPSDDFHEIKISDVAPFELIYPKCDVDCISRHGYNITTRNTFNMFEGQHQIPNI